MLNYSYFYSQIRLLHTALHVSDVASLVPCVWEIQDSVVSLLKHSVSRVSTLNQKRKVALPDDDNETILQSVLVTVLEKLCASVADYQKKETVVYIVQKLPDNAGNEEFQLALVECLLKMSAVCRKISRYVFLLCVVRILLFLFSPYVEIASIV